MTIILLKYTSCHNDNVWVKRELHFLRNGDDWKIVHITVSGQHVEAKLNNTNAPYNKYIYFENTNEEYISAKPSVHL